MLYFTVRSSHNYMYAMECSLNLFQYEKTLPYVFVEGTLDILLDLMQIYREKGIIFNRTCTLVGILGMDNQRRMVSNATTVHRVCAHCSGIIILIKNCQY